MKTTLDAIIHGAQFSVRHEDMLIEVSRFVKDLVMKHSHLDDVKDFCIGKRFTFEHEADDWDTTTLTFEAFPLIVYNKGVITISIQHDKLKCPDCEGTGMARGECYHCGNEIDEECEYCNGTGLFSDDWKDIEKQYNIDIPEIVLYKTLDLRQGELF